jgi:MFS family permease
MAGIIGADNRFAADFNHPDAAMQGNISGLYDIGCVVGSIVCYFVGEHFGRRTMLMVGGFIMIIGSILLSSSYTIAQLLVGRIITGIGNGMNSSTAPVYQSECSPANIWGALLTMQGTVTILGVVISYWIGEQRAWSSYLLFTTLTKPLMLQTMAPTSQAAMSSGASPWRSRPSSPSY